MKIFNMFKKIFYLFFIFWIFIWTIWNVFWNNQEINEQIKEISQENKEQTKTSKTELIKELAWSEEQNQIKNTEKKILELEEQLEKIWISNQSIKDVEKNLKKEIETIKETIEKWKSIWELQKENEILKKDLMTKKWLLDELNKEKISNELKKQELEIVISSYKILKEKYEDKIQQKRNERIAIIIINSIYFVLFSTFIWMLSFFLKRTKLNNEIIDTFKWIIISIVTTIFVLFVVINILQLFEQFLYIILLTLWSLIVSFKNYITSLISFLSSIAFKKKIWMYVKIDNKPCKITKINVFFTEVEIFWSDLTSQWKKTYFNDYFVLHSAILDIKELWVINTVKYKLKSNSHDELLITMIETLLSDETETMFSELENTNKILLSYWYSIWKDWDEIELTITLKSFKWKNSNVFKLIKMIDDIVNFHKKEWK